MLPSPCLGAIEAVDAIIKDVYSHNSYAHDFMAEHHEQSGIPTPKYASRDEPTGCAYCLIKFCVLGVERKNRVPGSDSYHPAGHLWPCAGLPQEVLARREWFH
jgi:hypothetical protein